MVIKGQKGQSSARIKAPDDAGTSTQLEKVILSFELLDNACIKSCPQADLATWVLRLRKLCSMTWKQVTQAPRQGLGHEKIARDQLKFSIPSTLPPDGVFLSFRFSDAGRMIGIRNGAILSVLFIDPSHGAY